MSEFVIAEVMPGKLNALVKNLMGQMKIEDPNEAVRRVNSGEWTVTPPVRQWELRDGLIHFSVTSDGTTGKEWVERLEKKGYRLSSHSKSVLRSSDFQSTKPDTFQIAVVPGSLFTSDPTTREVRQELDRRRLKHGKAINAELACLIREKFSDKELAEMGIWWIVVMHKPIKDSYGRPDLLYANRYDGGGWLHADYDDPDGWWDRRGGFAGVVSHSA